MNWRAWTRQTHRWLSIVFTVLVLINIVVNFVVPAPKQLTFLVGIVTLLPIALLLLTGLYLFVLPYTRRERGGETLRSEDQG